MVAGDSSYNTPARRDQGARLVAVIPAGVFGPNHLTEVSMALVVPSVVHLAASLAAVCQEEVAAMAAGLEFANVVAEVMAEATGNVLADTLTVVYFLDAVILPQKSVAGEVVDTLMVFCFLDALIQPWKTVAGEVVDTLMVFCFLDALTQP